MVGETLVDKYRLFGYYIYIITVLAVTITLRGFVANRV